MKKLFTSILFLLSIITVSAQDFEFTDSVNISRERWRDSLLRMDMNQVPTGFLFEYSLAGIDLSKFNGVNSDTLKNEGLILSLHEILNLSKVNSNAQIAPTDDLYNQAKSIYNNNKTVALIFIYQNYNRIRQSALSEGLFTIAADSVGILDAPGRTVSPYDTYEVFAFAPFKQTITQFNSINFTLPNELFYMQGFTNVEVDFDDGGGYRALNKGGNIMIYYGTEGIKNLTARITTTSGIKIAKSQLLYTRPASYSIPDSTFNIEVEPLYINDDDYFGIYNRSVALNTSTTNINLIGANIEIVKGCDGVFDKPIIIVEGFDPQGDFDIEDYKRRFRNAQFAITMSNYGYDFVYVDFTNNTTYIENNAKVLEAIINKVNQIKVGNYKSSIIGFSMGGLIARWCLKDMEDRSLDHQVENYFSYDAPHQGANSPLGMQYIAQELERDLPYLRWDKTFKKTLDGLRSKAARQMLVTHGDYDNGPFNWQPRLSTLDPLRAAFAERIVNKGYPQTTNNYGIAFGRGNNMTNKDAGNGRQFTPANPFNAEELIFKGDITTIILINTTVRVYAVPENNNKSSIGSYLFEGITFRKIFGLPILPTFTLRKREFKYRSQNSYDDAPGGFDNTQEIVKDNWFEVLGSPATTQGHDGHCFLPTVSALDLQNQSYGSGSNWQSNNLFYNIDNQIQNLGTVTGNDLITPSLSPFKAVITATTGTTAINEEHNGNINARFAAFIQRKILNANPVPCAGSNGLCGGVISQINQENNFCSSNIVILSVPRINGLVYNWTVDPNYLQIINGQGTNSILLRAIPNTSGIGSVSLNVSNNCVNLNFYKDVQITPTIVNFRYVGANPGNPITGEPLEFEVDPVPDAVSYTWYNDNTFLATTTEPYYSTFNWSCGDHRIYVLASTANCGDSDLGGGEYYWGLCSGSYRYSAYPNPANNELTIYYTDNKDKNDIDIKLLNDKGEILIARKLDKDKTKITFDTSKIPDGTYFLHVTEGNEKTKRQIIIKH